MIGLSVKVMLNSVSDECHFNPKVVFDEEKFNSKFDAAQAFIDYKVDEKEGDKRNYWSGKAGEVRFVYDLGCKGKVTEVQLRNSYGGKGLNRWVPTEVPSCYEPGGQFI